MNKLCLVGCVTAGLIHVASAAGEPSAGGGASNRILRKQATVPAARETVWRAWTTVEGLKSFFAGDAKVELRPGGPFEIYFSPEAPYGQRGAEGCTVLAYLPGEMLAFTWNAPPSIPKLREAGERTQVIIELEEINPTQTRVTLTQLGFGEGEDWDKYYAYFDSAWSKVLGWLTDKVRGDVVSERKVQDSWQDGTVKVSRYSGPDKRQDFEVELSATPADVWQVLTTPEGVKTFYPTNPIIELRPGGKWDLHGGKPNTIMAFIPNEMLAATGSAPPRFPEVQKGGHWGVFQIEPIGENSTRLRLSVVGWREGPEWEQAFDYFLKANAQFLTMIHRRFVEGPMGTK